MSLRIGWIAASVSLLGSGCNLMGLFDEPPAQGCTGSETRRVARACGICGGGTSLWERCEEGTWVEDYCENDPLDRDHDGHANAGCTGSPEACCTGVPLDCNDDDGAVHPDAPDCSYDDGSGTPETRPCAADCGSEGVQTCTATCGWGACVPPAETCNDLDDDCDGDTDEGFDCRRGASGPCTTDCGTSGAGLCTDACALPTGAACLPPADVCNGIDDNCDGDTDEGFDCARGSTVACTTGCLTTGTGTCTATCTVPDAATCSPPAEICNAEDDDCVDGADNGLPCVQGRTVECTTTCGTTGSGICTGGCAIPTGAACEPPVEHCGNGIDDDCDTATDEPEPGQCTPGDTVPCLTSCGTTGTGVCTAECAPPGAATCTPPGETCNAIDDDCDAGTDEDFACRQGRAGVACTTTCGTTGSGTCTEICTIPSPADCTPPVETCNAIDDDCDTVTDQTFPCVRGRVVSCSATCGTTGSGTCTDTCAIPIGAACAPPAETCNAIDDDCDGDTDETFACVRGRSVACTATCGTTGSGTCTDACAVPTGAACTPPAETCNAVDDDCDGGTDETFDCARSRPTSCTTTCGTTGSGTCTTTCTIPDPAACTPPAETCNAVDDDCDGGTDETFDCARGAGRSCTHACGGSGTQTCGSSCTWGACLRAETCDGCDEDGDTAADNGFACELGATRTCTAGASCTGGTQACIAGCTWEPCIPPPPVPLAPHNGAYSGSLHDTDSLRPRFRWLASAGCGGLRFEIQVDDSCATPGFSSCTFSSPEFSGAVTGALEIRPTSALAVSTTAPVGRRYYWRVRACVSASGPCSAWSAVRYLDVGRTRGDFNGDGYADLAIGTSGLQVGSHTQAGAVYVHHGSSTGLSATPAARIDSPVPSASGHFGTSLAVGDLDADGFGDLVASTPDGTQGVHVFRGGASGLAGTPVATFTPLMSEALFGNGLEAAGDTNGDGFADLVFGHANFGAGGSASGRAYVHHGRADLTAWPRPADVVLDSPAPVTGGQFGVRIASGDFDADGYADVAVTASGESFGGALTGRVHVFRGTPTGVSATVAVSPTLDGTAEPHDGDQFGGALAAGDLNRDGYADLLVGIPYYDRNVANPDAGGIAQFLGRASGPLETTSAIDRPSYFQNDRYGQSLSVGDIEGDGLDDAVAGVPGLSTGAGAVQILWSNAAGGLGGGGAEDRLNPDPAANDSFGYAVWSGDFNGDGSADFAAGAYRKAVGATLRVGTVWVYLAPTFSPSSPFQCPITQAYAHFGSALAYALPPSPRRRPAVGSDPWSLLPGPATCDRPRFLT